VAAYLLVEVLKLMHRTIIAIALALCAVLAPAAAAKTPDVIPLPPGFQPEGIATGRGASFYVGSIPTGDVYRGSLRTGRGAVLIDAPDGSSATGMKVDRRNRLWVSGGASKAIRVYDAGSGALVRAYSIPTAGFINDVTVTRRAAYFTDSAVQVLYRVAIGRHGAPGDLTTIPITGDLAYDSNPATFEANGIAATRDGKRLIVVQSHTGKLFHADPRTGVTDEIALDEPVVNGDGILLRGRHLHVVRNRDNLVVTLRLKRDGARTVGEVTSPSFNVPTTIAGWGRMLYVVNAQFGSPDTEFEVVRVPRR
jgi:sugar lactone lactonase YvrE